MSRPAQRHTVNPPHTPPHSEPGRHHSNLPDFWEIYSFLRRQPIAQAMEQLAFPAILTDESDTILYANEALCESHGYTVRQLVGMTPRLLLPIHQAAELLALRHRLVRGPAEKVLDSVRSDGQRQRLSFRLVALGVRLGAALKVQTVYLGVFCPCGSEAPRDLAMMTIPWMQLAGSLANPTPAEADGEAPACPPLSQREAQIKMLDLVGCDTKRIAHVLGISGSTVRVLRARIRQKTESQSAGGRKSSRRKA